MDRVLDVMTIFSLLLLAMVLLSVRRAHIRVEYSVSWLAAAFALLIFSCAGGVLARMAAWLGVTDVATALLMVSGAVFLLVLYRLSLLLSHLKDSNTALTQRLAILEYRLESLDEKDQAPARS